MEMQHIRAAGCLIPVIACNTVIVGTGAAGFNAADRLYGYGQTDMAIVTDGIRNGTSRNAGSDKQTYYKLTLSGDEPDSVGEMARTLFGGQCVDGDIALVEAALSVPCFLKLAELGVPFPTNRYGGYVGYKTDHDPKRRATSAGPLTSQYMTEVLEKSVRDRQIPIYDGWQVIAILTGEGRAVGLLCLNLAAPGDPGRQYLVFRCRNIIYATGGPAGIYADTVYPENHYGATGVALAAGAAGSNLTEWQYGLAALHPRWNVSGTYMQALPRFISVDRQGGDEREFLTASFADPGDLLTRTFHKGYEWPFDIRKAAHGSSLIDILVYLETSRKGRRVYLDYQANPYGSELNFSLLDREARQYLEEAGASGGRPFDRLLHMNEPAVALFRSKGVDLAREPLEIALCAQHNNGGLAIDRWWQTSLDGLYAAGEAAASHGVYRPGGGALNAGQVGSTRAALHISRYGTGDPLPPDRFSQLCAGQIAAVLNLARQAAGQPDTLDRMWQEARSTMSRVGGAIRDAGAIRDELGPLRRKLDHFSDLAGVRSPDRLGKLFHLQDILVSQYVCLSAMADYVAQGGKSRGSALYASPDGDQLPDELPAACRFSLDDGSRGGLIQEAAYIDGVCRINWRPVRPIPDEDNFFENVWRGYRANGNID